MKKLLFFSLLIIALLPMMSCHDETSNTWTEYAEWRDANDKWITDLVSKTNPDGSRYYERVIPAWNNNAYILMHWFNDRAETAGNLTPLYTSMVSVKYYGQLYDDTPFDSSYTLTDSLFNTTPGSVIPGWTIALAEMHVGDSCEVVIPYTQGYGSTSTSIIPPYSCLKFGIKLVDIPYYELKP